MTARDRRIDAFLNVGIWLLLIALLVPAGVVGWAIGRHDAPDRPVDTAVVQPAAASAASALVQRARSTSSGKRH
jgi:hypothetical protein